MYNGCVYVCASSWIAYSLPNWLAVTFDGVRRGAPATFLVGGVIKGWQEALVMMKPGAKWRLFVPPELAYGGKARRNVPGGSLLIFEVELTGVTAVTAAPASPTAVPATMP